ncbi:MAG: hypothetical protein LUE99_03855, partial [Bacteroides sp.]|nr:hypothetical protein [Bacteroides sp.]
LFELCKIKTGNSVKKLIYDEKYRNELCEKGYLNAKRFDIKIYQFNMYNYILCNFITMNVFVDYHVFDGIFQGSRSYIKGLYSEVLKKSTQYSFLYGG